MRFGAVLIAFLSFGIAPKAMSGELNFGLGFDYVLIGKLSYEGNPQADYEIFDNLFWQGRVSYSFDNGFRTGFLFDYYAKTVNPNSTTKDNLTVWGGGLWGGYGYGITESGNTLITGGMEIGYGRLTDKTTSFAESGGAVRIAGMAGVRFFIARTAWMEIDYRLAWQQFELATVPKRWYEFSGSSLRLSVDFPIFSTPERPEEE